MLRRGWRAAGFGLTLVLLRASAASGQTLPTSPGGSGDLFAPLTNLFNEAAVSLSGAFGLAYATAALLVA
ncbi:MAG TPA: hypothetical protein VNA86_03575, partial [bacterium]|nr:hypothetical protein [bacterium]